MSLTVAEVAYEYGAGTAYRQAALDGVSLEVEPGQLAVVLGGTGSGKSTLLRICAGIMPPTRGAVAIDGVDVSRAEGGTLRGRVGIVFQNPESQLFAETVLIDVAFGPRNLGLGEQEARVEAEAALASVGLDPAVFGSRSPLTLSGGEARRVAVAGVIAMEPAYLLLDEPTAGLDAAGRAAVLGVVEHARARAGVVVVSHDPEEFLPRADTVLLLDRGRQTYGGSVKALLADSTPLQDAGLGVPAVLVAQMLALDHGFTLPSLTLDPVAAADALALARGVAR